MNQNDKHLTCGTVVALFSYIAYSCVYLCRLNFSVASVGIKELGIMTDSQIGLISSLFLAAYAFGKILLGRAGDKLPPKMLIVGGLFLSSITNFIFGFFFPIGILYTVWFLNGIAQSLVWGPILRIVSSKFTAEKRASVVSLLATCVGTGSILGVVVANFGISFFDSVSAGFFLPAIITFITALFFLIFVHDSKETGNQNLPPMPLSELFRDPAFKRMIIPSFLHGIIKDNVNVWFGLFFTACFGLKLENLALYVFIIPFLTLIGRIVFLPVLKICHNNENLVACISLGICALLSALLAIGFLPLWASLICFGGIACTIAMANTTVTSVFPARYLERGCVSSVSSYMDVLTYSGASIGSVIFGILVEALGYSPMFIIWAVFAALCAIFLLNEAK